VGEELVTAPGLLVLPGGGWLAEAPTGVRSMLHELVAGQLPAVLARWEQSGTVMASVCTGAMLLSAGGVLRDRPAVTNRLALGALAAAGAEVHPEARVLDAGSVVTSGGPAAGLDLGVHLVSRFAGAEAGRKAAERLEHKPVGPVLELSDARAG
jgi:transcriptional regulator GlxA family with amidase domain